ncbi:MAG: protein-disulfide reductase DsbD domain-containing protein [Devosia sp.]
MLALLLITALTGGAQAGETPWQEVAPDTQARLISSDILSPDGTTLVGLEVDMPAGTNTYWYVPGETGIPTTFDFAGSTGITGQEPLWPYPLIETKTGYVDYVYRGPTVLPVELVIEGGAATVELSILMGICSEICVPVSAEFQLPLSFAAPDQAQSLRLTQALARVPLPWETPDAPIDLVAYDPAANALAIGFDPLRIDPLSIIGDGSKHGQLFGAPQKSPEPNLVLLPLLGGEGGRSLEGKPVRLTFMTDMGPYTLERQINSAASTAAGD